MTAPPSAPAPATSDATIDNGATTTQIRFLSQVGTDRHRAAALRGIDYLIAAQYPNGGWPQFFPLRKDYSRHITFNDDAMINAASLLEEVAAGRSPFAFVDRSRRARAADAVARATEVILKTQVLVDGALTAWCAQHDAVTLEPRPARTYEHVSLSGAETVGIVRFLMRQPRTPDDRACGGRRCGLAPRRAFTRRPMGALLPDRHQPSDLLRPRRRHQISAVGDRAGTAATATPGSARGRRRWSRRNTPMAAWRIERSRSRAAHGSSA